MVARVTLLAVLVVIRPRASTLFLFWQEKCKDSCRSSDLNVQNLIIYLLWDGPSKNKLVAFDIRTEKTAWSIEVGVLNADPQIANNVIYAPIGSQIIAYTPSGKMLSEYNAHRTPSKTSRIPAANFTVVNE